MPTTASHSRHSDAVIAVVYVAGVIVWVVQPDWLTRQPLRPVLVLTLGVSAAFGLLSGDRRALAAPLLFGLLTGVISAATTNGDLGRTGELVLGILWGVMLASATALGMWFRRRARSDKPGTDVDVAPARSALGAP
jgi:hypothetical protein